MKKHLIYIQSMAVAGLVSMMALSGCQDTDYPEAQPATTGVTSTSALVVNASNAVGIAALLQNTVVGSVLAPGNYAFYSPISVGSAQVRIRNSGGTLGTGDLSSLFTFLPNTAYSIFVTDSITRPRVVNVTGTVTDAGGVRFLQVVDTLTAPTTGNAKFRFFHLAPDVTGVASSTTAGPVSVRVLNASGASVATFGNRAYRNASGTTLRYTSVPAGTYVTQVYSGTAVPTLTVTPLTSSTVTMANGKIYTLYSQGLRRNNTLGVGVVQHN